MGEGRGEGSRAKRALTYSLSGGISSWSQPAAYSLALALLFSANASAVNWELAPKVKGGYKYNDNYRLDLPGDEIDVSGVEADALVTLRNLDPRTQFSITPRVRSTYFPDEREEDSNDYFLGAKFSDTTPRRRAGISVDFGREDVVRSELPSAEVTSDLGDADAVDAGRTLQRNRRDLVQVAPYFSYDFSQRYRTELTANYTDASFDRNYVNAQQDFRQYGAAAGVGFLTSQTSSVLVRALASEYETAGRDATGYGAEAEYSHNFSESSRFYVRLGAQQTEPDRGEKETNMIGGVGGQWSSPRNDLFVDLTRSVGAISAGTIVERHQLRVRINHDVSERVAVLAGVRAFRDESIDDASTYPTRKYATAETGVEWRWNRSLSLSATYNYLWQEYSDEPSDASSNGFLISVIYEPKRSN